VNVIHKFPLHEGARSLIRIQPGFKPLTVQLQHETPTLWAIVDDARPLEFGRSGVLYATGWSLEDLPAEAVHLGTIQIDGFVWHYFAEVLP
jgi:hypothetical protein